MNLHNSHGVIFAALLSLSSALVCQASEISRDAQEKENLDKAVYCMEILENRNELIAPFNCDPRYLKPDYLAKR